LNPVDKQWAFTVRLITLIVVLGGAALLLYSISWVVGLLLVSTLIVYIFYPLLTLLKKRFNMQHGLATGLVFLVFLLTCALIVSLIVPIIYFEATELIESFPHYLARFQDYISWLSQQIIIFEVEEEVRSYLVGLSDNIHQGIEYLAEASLHLIVGAVDFFLILFLVFYLLYDFHLVRDQFVDLVPVKHRALAKELIGVLDANVGIFIRGSLIRCFAVGVITSIVLLILGMPYAMLLGLIAGVFNFILYIGPYIAAVPALLLSFSPLTPSPFLIILVYVGIQVVDGMFLAPVVLGRIIKLRPITIIVSILVGGSLAGLLGMVLAVPLAGSARGILEIIKRGPAYREEAQR